MWCLRRGFGLSAGTGAHSESLRISSPRRGCAAGSPGIREHLCAHAAQKCSRTRTAGLDRRPGRQAWSARGGVAVVGGRGEELLEGAGAGPAGQVEERARLVVGAAGPGAAEGPLADAGAGGVVVGVEVARGEAGPL